MFIAVFEEYIILYVTRRRSISYTIQNNNNIIMIIDYISRTSHARYRQNGKRRSLSSHVSFRIFLSFSLTNHPRDFHREFFRKIFCISYVYIMLYDKPMVNYYVPTGIRRIIKYIYILHSYM